MPFINQRRRLALSQVGTAGPIIMGQMLSGLRSGLNAPRCFAAIVLSIAMLTQANFASAQSPATSQDAEPPAKSARSPATPEAAESPAKSAQPPVRDIGRPRGNLPTTGGTPRILRGGVNGPPAFEGQNTNANTEGLSRNLNYGGFNTDLNYVGPGRGLDESGLNPTINRGLDTGGMWPR